MNRNRSSLMPVVSLLLVVLALAVAYVAGYFLRGKRFETDEQHVIRFYESKLEASLFKSGARIESLLSGGKVYARGGVPVRLIQPNDELPASDGMIDGLP